MVTPILRCLFPCLYPDETHGGQQLAERDMPPDTPRNTPVALPSTQPAYLVPMSAVMPPPSHLPAQQENASLRLRQVELSHSTNIPSSLIEPATKQENSVSPTILSVSEPPPREETVVFDDGSSLNMTDGDDDSVHLEHKKF